MSEKKQTAAENNAAAKKTGPVVYCGPSVKNTVKQFTVYSDGDALPDAVTDFLNSTGPDGFHCRLRKYSRSSGKPQERRGYYFCRG